MRRIFELPRYMTARHEVIYSIIALVTIFLLAVTFGMILALGGKIIGENTAMGAEIVKDALGILSGVVIE